MRHSALWLTYVCAVILVFSIEASLNAAGDCILQTKKLPSRIVMQPKNDVSTAATLQAEVLQPYRAADKSIQAPAEGGKFSSFYATLQAEVLQPYGPADKSIQAPAEGGNFSSFYNNRLEGRGIHKWLQYFPAYERHFAKFIGKEVHIAEIGVQSGGSLDMWKEVFGLEAHVYGCDIDPHCKAFEDQRTKIFIGDQQSAQFWENVTKEVPQIDILIDDGGHTLEQQIATLGMMLPRLSPDGVYVTEDIHGADNPFWQRLQFEHLQSPAGDEYLGLGSLVASVHIYPYLLVVERQRTSGDAIVRHLEASPSVQPADLGFAVLGTTPQPVASRMEVSLQVAFPWLRWRDEVVSKGYDLPHLMESLQPKGLLFVRDGNSEYSADAPWDAQADAFMLNIISSFKILHAGDCCDWTANDMQKNIDSLHIYPHLLIAKRTDGSGRVVKAPSHGTEFIPYR